MILESENILFLSRSTQFGGTENVVLQLCEIFNPLANKVVVASATPGGVFEDKLKRLGIKHYELPDIEDKSPTTFIRTIKILRKIVKDEQITVIHTHHRMAAFYVRFLRFDRKCCYINTSHNTFTNHKMLTRYAYKNAHLIACGEMVKRNLVDVFGLTNVSVIHNAVSAFDYNTAEDDLLLKKLREQGNILVGNIGRLSEQKGMRYFIQAVPSIVQSQPNMRFFVVGSGEEEGTLRQLSNDLGIEKYIIFTGYRVDIQNFMRQMDLIVLSSLWEGLPLTPIEAFSVSKTIIATTVDGTVEIVKDEENGLLIEPRNPELLAEKILWIINHPEDRHHMEKRAYMTFNMRFSFEKLRDGYVNCYKRI